VVLDGIISTIVGIIGFALMVKKFAPIQATGMVYSPNSVNPKLFEHGNTEPSMNFNKFKACVEHLQRASQADEDKCRTVKKFTELTRNELVACHWQVVTDLRLHSFHEHQRHDRNGHPGARLYTDPFLDRDPLRGKEKLPTISAMGLNKQSANSVNPKPFRHGNTEPSMNFNRFKACVENVHGSSQVDEDSFRTAKKFAEPTGNKLVAC
jgi:hypothetical protein